MNGKRILYDFFSNFRHPQRQSAFNESTLVAAAYNANSRFFTKCYLEAASIWPPPATVTGFVCATRVASEPAADDSLRIGLK
jgi:hypothetical protein